MSDNFVLPSVDLVFTQIQGQQENSLKGKMLQGCLFKGFKRSLCQLVQNQGEVPRGNTPTSLNSVSVETFQETSDILILADINRGVA